LQNGIIYLKGCFLLWLLYLCIVLRNTDETVQEITYLTEVLSKEFRILKMISGFRAHSVT